jgi:hypothetical protein
LQHMEQKTLILNVSPELYERIQQMADSQSKSVDALLLDRITASLDELPSGRALDDYLETLKHYTDEDLWITAHVQLPLRQEMRLRELNDKIEEGLLTEDDRIELSQLLDAHDRKVLIRSEALALLQERGYDIKGYLNLKP